MYRGRNRSKTNKDADDGSVRGPNSALTQFLKEQGISAESIRQRWLKSREKEGGSETDGVKKEGGEEDERSLSASTRPKSEESGTESGDEYDRSDEEDEEDDDDDADETESQKITRSRLKANGSPRENRLKRFAAESEDSDEEEYDEGMSSRTISETPVPLQQEDHALKIKKSKQQLQQRRRKKKRAAELLDRKTRRISTLQDICISQISANISKLQKETSSSDETLSQQIRQTLGGISTENMNKLARTLSKNRALNDHTLQLFLKTDLESLTFHDCSKVSYEGYKLLAIFAPHLSELSLQMCGQLNNEALLYIAQKLPNLNALYLDGPFLINESTWDEFFSLMKNRLKAFHVSNTHRFTDHSLRNLLENCGESLVSLRLSRLDAVFDYSLVSQYLRNPNFEHLSLEYPNKEELVSDDIVIDALKQVGPTLKHLSLNGCFALTDATFISAKDALSSENSHSSMLENLQLEELDQITTDGMVYFFSNIQMPNLKNCSLRRCFQLQDMAVSELFLNEASKSLTDLSLNSLKDVKGECFEAMECPKLKRLDVGFMGCVNDKLVKNLGERNPDLEILEVFGDNLVSRNAVIRPGLTVIGRQSDTL
ncbi:RAD7-like protein [Lachancea thermotolerans]